MNHKLFNPPEQFSRVSDKTYPCKYTQQELYDIANLIMQADISQNSKGTNYGLHTLREWNKKKHADVRELLDYAKNLKKP